MKLTKTQQAMFHGLAGDYVKTMDPHTEADPVAVLAHFLVAFGNAAGRNAFFDLGKKQFPIVYAAIIGNTSSGRKGTAAEVGLKPFETADPAWFKSQVLDSVSSGEALITAIRDEETVQRVFKDEVKTLTLPGFPDKRLFIVWEEFGMAFKKLRTDGSTLSARIRDFWGSPARSNVLVKDRKTTATRPHVSFVGHCTPGELKAEMTQVERLNGFANRFLWVWSQKSKTLPLPTSPDPFTRDELTNRLKDALAFARNDDNPLPMDLSPNAQSLWKVVHAKLENNQSDLMGTMCGRAAPMTLRLAMIYALLDQTTTIGVDHLQAAFALTRYSRATVRWLHKDKKGNKKLARLTKKLKAAGEKGLTESEITNQVFHNNATAKEKQEYLNWLLARDLVCQVETPPGPKGGAPSLRWFWKANPN